MSLNLIGLYRCWTSLLSAAALHFARADNPHWDMWSKQCIQYNHVLKASSAVLLNDQHRQQRAYIKKGHLVRWLTRGFASVAVAVHVFHCSTDIPGRYGKGQKYIIRTMFSYFRLHYYTRLWSIHISEISFKPIKPHIWSHVGSSTWVNQAQWTFLRQSVMLYSLNVAKL